MKCSTGTDYGWQIVNSSAKLDTLFCSVSGATLWPVKDMLMIKEN